MNSTKLRSTVTAAVCRLTMTCLLSVPAVGGELAQNAGCLCLGAVGNVNCDYADQVTLGDLAFLIDHLYISGIRLPNEEEANINGDPDGVIDLADVAVLIDHLFITRIELPLCPAPPNAPPETRIVGLLNDVPFIDGLAPGGATTGVFLEWTVQDLVDHPYLTPAFECEYRLYGPYPDSLLELILDSFTVKVFRPDPYVVLRVDQPPDTLGCDTVYIDDQIDTIICHTLGARWVSCDTSWDGGVREIVCDTLLLDTLNSSPSFGRVDTILDLLNPDFVSNPRLNRIAHVSYEAGDTWTSRQTDTLYDVYAGHRTDTTQLQNFIFWVRSRDPVDPSLLDPVPAFAPVRVLDPQFERDVLVINWTSVAHENRALSDSSRVFWKGAIESWIASGATAEEPVFDSTRDLVWAFEFVAENSLLETAVRYKILILEQDAATSGAWSVQGPLSQQVFAAVATGATAWAATRVPVGSHPLGGGPATHVVSDEYEAVFGVQQVVFTGWARDFFADNDGYGFGRPRIEDFVGAFSEDTGRWPDLAVDTSYLRTRYDWQGSLEPLEFPYYPYLAEIGALPEVGWAEPSPDAEIMYRYQSLYGDTHPIYPELSFQGNPVMHRLDRGTSRTVHGMFTPLALDATDAQLMVNAVLDWLYEPWIISTSQSPRQYLPTLKSTSVDLRSTYLEWRQEWSKLSTPSRTMSRGTK